MAKYIYEYPNWPQFSWDDIAISSLFGEVRMLQGLIAGQMKSLGFSSREEASLTTLIQDVIKSSEIEGEYLDYQQVRSSIAKRLGIPVAGVTRTERNVDGIVDMMLDTTQNYLQPLTSDRLFGWHAALFPTGYSGMHKIEVGRYRTGDMQIVSGAMGKEKVHYQAVPSQNVAHEMEQFLLWFNGNQQIDPVMKAAVAHFWFIIIHPFDDGNGRIARAITDMLLARAEGSPERYYSMSAQVMVERKQYYSVLQEVQHSSGDITDWLLWFLGCLKNALLTTEDSLQSILRKTRFWQIHERTELNARQRMMLNKLLDGLEGKLKSSKWAKMAKCSPDTALRDIKDLMEKGILQQESAGGRSTNYELVEI